MIAVLCEVVLFLKELSQIFIVKLSKVLMMLSICLHNNCISLILVLTKKFDVGMGKQGLSRKGRPQHDPCALLSPFDFNKITNGMDSAIVRISMKHA